MNWQNNGLRLTKLERGVMEACIQELTRKTLARSRALFSGVGGAARSTGSGSFCGRNDREGAGGAGR